MNSCYTVTGPGSEGGEDEANGVRKLHIDEISPSLFLTEGLVEQDADAIINTPPSPNMSMSSLSAEVQHLRRQNKELQSKFDEIINSQELVPMSQEEETFSSLHDEHKIFVQAILGLLTERDQLAIKAEIHCTNTIKVGSLRKSSRRIRGLWKKKYVEIRKGTFSYFDDSAKQRSSRNEQATSLSRKDVPLRMPCTCQAVRLRSAKLLPGNVAGAVFELRIQGSRRLWMAPTREARQSWIQAILSAVPGASVTRGVDFSEHQGEQANGEKKKKKKHNAPLNSPKRRNFEQYLDVRAASHGAESKSEYLGAISCLRGQKVTLPVSWIKLQLDKTVAAASFLETEISSSVEQLWKDLLRDSVEINGCIITGETCHCPDRILGKLTQEILLSDLEKCLLDGKQRRITESEAVSYARDILLASNRTNSGGSSYFCAENLCSNRNLVVLCPSSTEANPLSIKVSACKQNKNSNISSWVSGRRISDKTWKRQHLVLSQSVLSCYTEEPHELFERIILQGAEVDDSSFNSDLSVNVPVLEHVLSVTTKEGQVHQYLFDEPDFLIWLFSLKKSAGNLDESAISTNIQSDLCNKIRPSVEVLINVCTEYRLCTLDPSGIESEDTWA